MHACIHAHLLIVWTCFHWYVHRIFIYTYMCVWNLWRDVKLLSCCFSISFLVVSLHCCYYISSCRGAEGTCKALPNKALCKHPRKHGLIIRVYLQGCDHLLFRVCFQFLLMPSWQPAKPRTGKTICLSFLYRTVVAICQFGSDMALLNGKGRLPIYSFCTGYGNGSFLILCRVFSSTHSCQVWLECFSHARCIPQQNSQWQFWASVWLMLDSSWWHEPFGEYLSR